MNQNTSFSRRLRGLFTITDYQPAALAKCLGVGVQTVRQWESGTAVPDVNQFREISAFFGLRLVPGRRERTAGRRRDSGKAGAA